MILADVFWQERSRRHVPSQNSAPLKLSAVKTQRRSDTQPLRHSILYTGIADAAQYDERHFFNLFRIMR